MTWHYLRHNAAEWGPQHIVCLDTETTREHCPRDETLSVERFRLGVARYCRLRGGKPTSRAEFCFNSPSQFWDWLESKVVGRQIVWVFAHNAGFDLRVLDFFGELDRGRFRRTIAKRSKSGQAAPSGGAAYRVGSLVTADPPTIIECWTSQQTMLRFVDSCNYFRCPLAALGESIGLAKLPMPDPWEPDETWLTYCRRDCEILETAMLAYVQWCRDEQLGVFRLTTPSQAMGAYRHRFFRKKILLHDEEPIKKLEREGYLGGELAVNYQGHVGERLTAGNGLLFELDFGRREPLRGPVHQLDCNSLFPSVMASERYPCRLVEWGLDTVGRRSLSKIVGGDCVAECLLDTGVQDVYSRRAGRSARFSGYMVAVLCGPELQRAVDAGAVVAVRRWARYELADLFSTFVEHWWQKRWLYKLAGNNLYSDLCKNLMNSLYGKWGQRVSRWKDLPGVACPYRWSTWSEIRVATGEIVEYRSVGDDVQIKQDGGDHPQSFVAIAAFVTAYAREKMRKLREIAGAKNWYYQGIDSLYVSDAGLANLTTAGAIDQGRLGALRHEASADYAAFYGHGLYQFGDRVVRTSIRRGAIDVGDGSVRQEAWEHLDTALAEVPAAGVRVHRVDRELRLPPIVGTIDRYGWVHPPRAVWGGNPNETVSAWGVDQDGLGDKQRQAITADLLLQRRA